MGTSHLGSRIEATAFLLTKKGEALSFQDEVSAMENWIELSVWIHM